MLRPRPRLARGLKAEAGALNFVHLMAKAWPETGREPRW